MHVPAASPRRPRPWFRREEPHNGVNHWWPIVICGGIDILVPKGWRISVRSTPIFGGLDDKTDHSQVPPDAPTLHVDALTVLGGVDIKHEK